MNERKLTWVLAAAAVVVLAAPVAELSEHLAEGRLAGRVVVLPVDDQPPPPQDYCRMDRDWVLCQHSEPVPEHTVEPGVSPTAAR